MIETSDLINYTSDPAFTLDKNMRVRGWNEGAQELLGYSSSEALGKLCNQVLQANYPTGEPLCSILCEGRACIADGHKWGISDCQVRHKDGEMIQAGLSSLVLPIEARKGAGDDAIALIFLRRTNDGAEEVLPDARLRVFSLGSFGLTVAGNGLDVDSWKRKKALLVLKCMISQLDKPVHRERLIDWIWPESDPVNSWPRLKVTISYLRSALRDGGASANVLETVGQSYILRRSSVWIDSEAFCKRVSAGWEFLAQDKLKEALEQFEEAESLYRGDFIEDEPYAEWCTVERERLREIYLELLGGLVKCYTESGDHMMASRVCRLALSSDPCRENFIRALMECLVSMNRTDWARAHFISWRRTLDQEYELQPTEETLDVFRRIVGEDATKFRSTA